MKAKIIFLGLITLYCSCQEAIRKGRPFPEVNTDSVTVIPTDEEHAEVIKVTDNVKSKVLSSELIEDFYYIPLETTDESLFAYCNNLEFYEDKIYLFDRLGAEKLFIFDKYGKFLNYVGDKGGAPSNFMLLKHLPLIGLISNLSSMTIKNVNGWYLRIREILLLRMMLTLE